MTRRLMTLITVLAAVVGLSAAASATPGTPQPGQHEVCVGWMPQPGDYQPVVCINPPPT